MVVEAACGLDLPVGVAVAEVVVVVPGPAPWSSKTTGTVAPAGIESFPSSGVPSVAVKRTTMSLNGAVACARATNGIHSSATAEKSERSNHLAGSRIGSGVCLTEFRRRYVDEQLTTIANSD